MALEANRRPTQNVSNSNEAEAESDRPLLGSFPNPSGYGTRPYVANKQDASVTAALKCYLVADIDTRWADLILILCFFICGLIDAGAYNAYECFTAMQTGNTIYAALGISNLPSNQPRLAWTKSVCAIVCYLFGAAFTKLFHSGFGERRRWVLCFSFTIQAALILVSAILVRRGQSSGYPASVAYISMVPEDPGFPWMDLVPIGLLSFQAAGKLIASRVLQYTGLPCVVLTTIYGDLVADPKLLSTGLSSNLQRNRRAAGVLSYFLGAVIGGAAAKINTVGFSGGLGIAAVLQLCVAGAWLLWKPDTHRQDVEEG